MRRPNSSDGYRRCEPHAKTRRAGTEGMAIERPERIRPRAYVRFRDSDDDRDIRAAELEDAHLERLADRVARCGRHRPDGRRQPCNVRVCPWCAVNKHARAHRSAINEASQRMLLPGVACVLRARSVCLDDMTATVAALRTALDRLKRHAAFAYVHGGIMALEVAFYDTGAPNVHMHGWLDALPDRVQALSVDEFVRGISGNRVSFSIESNRGAVTSAAQYSAYLSKPGNRCPPVNELRPAQLRALVLALRGRRIVSRWGTAAGKYNVSRYARDGAPERLPAMQEFLQLVRDRQAE